METKGNGEKVRSVRGGCGCQDANEKQPSITPVEVPGSHGEQFQLSEREHVIYLAGQAFGSAQAYRQCAEYVNKLSQCMNAQAEAQLKEGHRLLGLVAEGAGTRAGRALGKRVRGAIDSLVGNRGGR